MDKGRIIKGALAFLKEDHKPIKTSELEQQIGNHIIAVHPIYGNDMTMYDGELEVVGTTFHPRVASYIHFKNGIQTWHTKKLLGWKQRPHIYKNQGKEITEIEGHIGSAINIEIIYSGGSYYPVHIGRVLSHEDCEYCDIADTNDWIRNYKDGALYFTPACMDDEEKEILRKYPKKLKKHFGTKTINKLLREIKSK